MLFNIRLKKVQCSMLVSYVDVDQMVQAERQISQVMIKELLQLPTSHWLLITSIKKYIF